MKKLTALFTVVAMLVCMFAIAPTASAETLSNHRGERVSNTTLVSGPSGTAYVTCVFECRNGWLDGTYGSDFVSASMSATAAFPCSASIDINATYIYDGSYMTESDSDSTTIIGGAAFTVSIYPSTDLLSSGSASFEMNSSSYGNMTDSLSASCPTNV